MALDPLSARGVRNWRALHVSHRVSIHEALRFGQRALELHADFAVALYALGLTYCRMGQFDRASDAFERLLTSSNRAPFFVGWGAIAHALAGRRRETLTLAEDLAARHPSEYVHPVTPVLIGIALGDRHQTEDAVRAFIHQNGSGFQIGHVVPFLEEWRFKPGFVELLRRLHLEPESAERNSTSGPGRSDFDRLQRGQFVCRY